MAKTVKLNPEGIAALLSSQAIGDLLENLMQPALRSAQDDPHDDTGDYERGLHLERVHTDRVVVRLVSDDWKGRILEANYGILARALDQAR